MLDIVKERILARPVALTVFLFFCACGDLALPGRARIEGEDPELRASAQRMLRDLERLSGLKATAPIHVSRQNEAGLRDLLYGAMEESQTELEAALEAYVILGLAPETFDVYTLVRAQVNEIAGYYHPETKRLYILDKVARAEAEVVLAHELVHAIQDQHFDLRAGMDDLDDDKAMAFQAAVEGHASMVMAAWLIEQITGGRVDPAAMPSVADQIRRSPIASAFAVPNGPRALQRMFYFPYVEGSSFVRMLWKYYPDRLAAGLDTLRPNSTEQVLNPERALLGGRDEPIAIAMDLPPGGWNARFEATMGEFTMRLILEESLGSSAATAAGGWRGDHLRLLDDGGDARVLQWLTAWDDDARADAFARVALRFIESRGPRWNGSVTRSMVDDVPVVHVELANNSAWFGNVRDLAR